ncbi:MAG TPA: adenylosuccinate lyase, partial [Bacteroidales bacterium]|nr:adenylosuccinate lyase [Bacteroidales bacterium]
MQLHELTAITPIDGRYRAKIRDLSRYFSEYALIKYRVEVEIEYFIALCQLPLPQLSGIEFAKISELREVYSGFNLNDAARIKEIEKTTNHDVKAVEYFIKEKFDELRLSKYKEFIHFGLTSQDINNTATPALLKSAFDNSYYPMIEKVVSALYEHIAAWEQIPMLARTHG